MGARPDPRPAPERGSGDTVSAAGGGQGTVSVVGSRGCQTRGPVVAGIERRRARGTNTRSEALLPGDPDNPSRGSSSRRVPAVPSRPPRGLSAQVVDSTVDSKGRNPGPPAKRKAVRKPLF